MLHLNVIQNDGNTNAKLVGDYRTEIAFNGDYSAFRAVELKWWDDASYIAYQARDLHDEPPVLGLVDKGAGLCASYEWSGFGVDEYLSARAECTFGGREFDASRVADYFGRCDSLIPF